MNRSRLRVLAGIALVLLAGGAGCASSRMQNTKIDSAFRSGDYAESTKLLQAGLDDEKETGRDGLLYLFDLGISLHQQGDYEGSIKAFRRADSLAEIKDYTSLSSEAGTLFTSDNIKQYKGEEFENVLINVYLALDYALLGKLDDALIESRRVNRKLYLMISEGKRKYDLSAFAAYFSGVLFEARGEWNDAYVSYKQTRDILPSYEGIGEDLIRIAARLHMSDEVKRWRKEYPSIANASGGVAKSSGGKGSLKDKDSVTRPPPNYGQIVVIFQNGFAPRKRPSRAFYSIPEFHPVYDPVTHAKVTVEPLSNAETKVPLAGATPSVATTEVFQNIEADAIRNLKEKWGGILAKKIAGIAAKETVGAVINSRTGNSGLGDVVKLLMYVSDQADVRSWTLLPKDLQLARFFVPPGTYSVKISPLERPNAATERVVQVMAGKTAFANSRYTP